MNPNIGNKIKQLREEHQLSLAELAANASIYPMQLEKIESGEIQPTMAIMVRISRALGTRLGTILDGEEHYEPVVQLSTDRTPSINLVESENLGSHLRFSALAQNKTDRNMEPFFINVGYCPTGDLPSHHEGFSMCWRGRYSCFTDRKPIRWRKATASITIRSCRITSRRWPKGKRPKCWP